MVVTTEAVVVAAIVLEVILHVAAALGQHLITLLEAFITPVIGLRRENARDVRMRIFCTRD